jgi:hypothetical protein
MRTGRDLSLHVKTGNLLDNVLFSEYWGYSTTNYGKRTHEATLYFCLFMDRDVHGDRLDVWRIETTTGDRVAPRPGASVPAGSLGPIHGEGVCRLLMLGIGAGKRNRKGVQESSARIVLKTAFGDLRSAKTCKRDGPVPTGK